MRSVRKLKKLPLAAMLISLLLLAACSSGGPDTQAPQSGSIPEIDVYLLVGSERQPIGGGSAQVAGPTSQFEVVVRDRTGIRTATYSFNGRPAQDMDITSRGSAIIQPATPLTGTTGTLNVTVVNNDGVSVTERISFSIDSVAPTITSIRLNNIEYVGDDLPQVQLYAGGSGGAALLVQAIDRGAPASQAWIVLEINGEVADAAAGTLNTLISSAGLSNGNHTARVYAVDAAGNLSGIYDFVISVVEQGSVQPPTVTIERPQDNAVLAAGQEVTVVVNATPGSAEISTIEVALDGDPLTAIGEGRYSGTAPTTPGSYLLTARAAGMDGGQSLLVTHTVEVSDTPPTVVFNAPDAMREYRPGAEVRVTLDVQNAGGGIGSVEVTLDGDAPVSVNGYAYTFTAPSAESSFTILAVASNLLGSQESVTEQTIVVAAAPAPTVTILSPAPDHIVGAGEVVVVDLDIIDNGGGIRSDSVLVSLGGARMVPGTDPVTGGVDYTTWTLPAPSPLPGELDRFEIRASAASADGSRLSPTAVQDLFVDVTPPTVQLVRPGFGGHVPAKIGELEIEVLAEDHGSDVLEITVEAYQHNSTVGTWITIATFTEDQSGVIDWNLGAGGWFLRATARDRFGNVGISESVPVFSADGDIPINTNLVLREPVVNEMIVSPDDDLTFVISHLTRELYLATGEGWVELYLGTELVSPAVPITFGTSATFGDFAEISWTVPALEPGDYTFWIWHHHENIYGPDPISGAPSLLTPAARTHQPVILRVQ